MMEYRIFQKTVFLLCSIVLLLGSCEKEVTYGTVSEARQKQAKLVQDLKEALQGGEDGWVMMLKSNLSGIAYTPLVMQFDTSKNTVDMLTVYGLTVPSETHFSIGEGTAHPLLIFSTGSVMTALYRMGAQASDLTDHMFKVLSVSNEEIVLQCYRGGGIYAAEGGPVYSLFKRPKDWTWADKQRYFDLDNAGKWAGTFLNYGRPSDLKLTYPRDNRTLSVRMMNTAMQASLITNFRRSDPFNSDRSATGIFEPFYPFWMYFTRNQSYYQTAVTLGHNSMSFYPFTVSQNITTSTHVRYLLDYVGVHYLVATSVSLNGNSLRTTFAAYNQKGEPAVLGEYMLN